MSSVHDSELAFRLQHLLGPRQDLPQVDLSSTGPLPELGPAETAPTVAPESRILVSGSVWLDGNVLMCGCPDCGAPMSIRLWLLVADCWQCGTSIELSEELIRDAQRLLAQREKEHVRRRRAATAPSSAPEPPRHPPEPRPVPAAPIEPKRRPEPPPQPRSSPAAAPEVAAVAATPTAARPLGATAWVRSLFKDTPAWLASLIFHLILLTLLGLLTLGRPEDIFITLSTAVNKHVEAGGEVLPFDPQDEITYDLLPKNVDLEDPKQRAALVRADRDAKKLRLDPDAVEPNLPELQQVKQLVTNPAGVQSALAARDPRIRVEMLKREGGTMLTEAAVARGLRWLAIHQARDGRWSLDRFNRTAGCNCRSAGIRSDSAATSLALLPFLGAGQTHLVGTYRNTVARGLRWLLDRQKPDGDLRADSRGNTGMYAHGQGAIVLCEAFFMTGDQQLREPAQKAIDFIVEAQHSAGGWRYAPGMEGDTSVLGWQLMALQSARAANLAVPEETLDRAGSYLDQVGFRGGAVYGYMPRKLPDEVMTAEALLCRAYLGWNTRTPLGDGVAHLTDHYLPDAEQPNIYYWYYGTQLLHHVGGAQWQQWNERIREILVTTQRRLGHSAGSWDPIESHDRAGGRLYATALATCTLEVYYRHLPIFRQIDLD